MANTSPVMFRGNVTHKLDPKSRVAVPAGWRAAQNASLCLIDSCYDGYNIVKCYTDESFERMIDTVRTQALEKGIDPGEVDRYLGRIIGSCFEAEVSSQGKLLIPKQQRERLRLRESVRIVGRGAYFELWSPEDYEVASTPAAVGTAQQQLDRMFHVLS